MVTPSAQRSACLRQLLAAGPVVMPGAINALSARLIEREGFPAMYLSGAVLANSVGGVPDVGLMTLTEAREHAARIASATTIPILMDADTGYGGADNAARTVRELENVGVSAIHLEDQEFPKRCGHLDGKRLVPEHEMCEKIASAAGARTSPDFIIIARTDARGVVGYDEAVRRAHLYLNAGADGIFPEALATREEFERFARDMNPSRNSLETSTAAKAQTVIPAQAGIQPVPSALDPRLRGGDEIGPLLLANVTEFGKSPLLSADEFAAMGYRIIIFPVTLQRIAMKAMHEALGVLKAEHTQAHLLGRMQTRQELYDLLGYEPEGRRVGGP